MIEIKRREGESVESLLRRFTKKVQQSGLVARTKKRRFYEPPKTKREERAAAVRRTQMRVRRDFLKRTGQLTDEDLKVRNPKAIALIKRGLKK